MQIPEGARGMVMDEIDTCIKFIAAFQVTHFCESLPLLSNISHKLRNENA